MQETVVKKPPSIAILKGLFLDLILYSLMCLATLLMLRIILDYGSMKTDVRFLKVKQEYLPNKVWKFAFYTHVFSSIFTLIAGFTQFSSYKLKEYPKLHRIIGKLYVIDILFINFPAAFIMGIYGNGLMPGKAAFIVLDCLWFYFTLKAFIEIKRGNITAHKNYMMRSYALTFSAITLRSWQFILSRTLHLDPLTLYIIDAWMGFVPNLLFVECLLYFRKHKLSGQS